LFFIVYGFPCRALTGVGIETGFTILVFGRTVAFLGSVA